MTREPAGAHGRRGLRLRRPARPGELRSIRRGVDRWAEQNGLAEDDVIDLQLAVGEAVANGVEHAYGDADGASAGDATVDVELDIPPLSPRVVAVRVTDHGCWRAVPAEPGYRGRGLALIERLSRGMRVTSTVRGTEICFEIVLGGR